MHRTVVGGTLVLLVALGCRRNSPPRASDVRPRAASAPDAAGAVPPVGPASLPLLPALPGVLQAPRGTPAVPGATTPPAGTSGLAVADARAGDAAVPLAIPGTIAGSLTASDARQPDGSVADEYALRLTAGAPVTIVVRGGPAVDTPGRNLDVFAVLLLENTEVTHDDDSADNVTNARIVFTPTTSGTYILRVTTFGGGLHEGPYTVQTWTGANDEAN
jgi:hypothetical protein